jgi:hypothetical protein
MECIIADATATSKIVLWNNNVNKFQVNSSYDVITWSASPYLPTTKVDEFSMKVIDDIGNVQPQVSTSKTLTNCSIIGIKITYHVPCLLLLQQ